MNEYRNILFIVRPVPDGTAYEARVIETRENEEDWTWIASDPNEKEALMKAFQLAVLNPDNPTKILGDGGWRMPP